MKKSLRKVFAGVMALLLLASCSNAPVDPAGEDAPSPGADTVPAEETEPVETEDSRLSVPDNLPEIKFDGREFRVLTTTSKEFQFRVDELNGEVTNDAVFNRNETVEDRFDAKIVTVLTGSPYDQINQYVKAAADECEIVDHFEYKAYTPISQHSYLDWNTIPYIDQNQPWWNKDSNEGSVINGKLFCIVGDLSITAMQFTYAMFFDMDLTSQYGYSAEDMYATVFEGKWTLDRLQSIAESIYADLNANGKSDDGDTLGYAYWNLHGTDVWVTAIGEHITKYEDGQLVVTLGTEKVFNALDKVINLVFNTDGAYRFNDETHGRNEFISGRVAIMPMMFEDCYGPLRDMEYAYSVLPYPKYDEAQEEYYTNSMDQHSVFGVPVTLPTDRYDFVGVMMEALNAESWKTVYPAFYDTALKNKYSEDATTARMIDLIMDGRVYEFSFQFGEYLNALPYMFRNELYSGQNNLASTLQKSSKSLRKLLEKLYAMYE
ncbi:MAG: hypothetical protein II680_00900 [Clostridia bacterium]|nr:hypothetical protein [Clostridia bacterium]